MLTLMLMQGALEKMAYTKGCIERKHAKVKAEHVSKASFILLYLRDTLDMQSGADIPKLAKQDAYKIQRQK